MSKHHKDEPRPLCPNCASDRINKDGEDANGQLWKCRMCGKKFRHGFIPKVEKPIPSEGPYSKAEFRTVEWKPMKSRLFDHWKLHERK